MSRFPGSPRLSKGAIVGIDPFDPLARVVEFQYNPDAAVADKQYGGFSR
jgi:hypothetical protein